jgi:hypothetical protein
MEDYKAIGVSVDPKRMNNIHILIIVRLGWPVVARVWKWKLFRAWQRLGLGFGGN